MFFSKKKEEHSKNIWVKKTKNKGVSMIQNKNKRDFIFSLLIVFIVVGSKSFANISLPFQDTLDFALGLTKTIGGTIIIIGLVLALIFYNQGREGTAIKLGVWIFISGVIISNLDWLADKVGMTSGALFF